MAEVQVSNVTEEDKNYDAIATTDDVFPNMVDHVEIIIRGADTMPARSPTVVTRLLLVASSLF